VQALVADKNGVLYAGTSPDGKVYRIEPGAAAAKPKPAEKAGEAQAPASSEIALDPAYSSSVYFEPKTKYIWDVALASDGTLYIATGDRGEIFRVPPKGEGALFFKSDEAHIRVLALDGKGNLVAGSDGSGLIYRISPSGEAFVLYSAPKKEITALALDKDGNIYAAGTGEKRSGGAVAPMTPAATAGGCRKIRTTPPTRKALRKMIPATTAASVSKLSSLGSCAIRPMEAKNSVTKIARSAETSATALASADSPCVLTTRKRAIARASARGSTAPSTCAALSTW